MENEIIILGSDVVSLSAALVLARSQAQVHIVTDDEILNKSRDEGIAGTGEPCRFRPDLELELEVLKQCNIKIHYMSHLREVKEVPHGLIVEIEKLPRYVDEEHCASCGMCEEACPVSIKGHKAIYSYGKTRVPSTYAIAKKDLPPCRRACPAGVNAQGYIALIRAGRYEEALALERERNPFAGVSGRVCQRPCERECLRNQVDNAVAIRDLKRFIAEYGASPGKGMQKKSSVKLNGKKAAIIGGGPAGLTCAKDLSELGYEVTVFEERESLGGMLSWAIPSFRLPRDILKKDLDYVLSPGMKINCGKALGRNFSLNDLKREGFSAIFLAIGAQVGLDLEIPGYAKRSDILNAIDFLRMVDEGHHVGTGKRVLVIGGGNAAIDAARVARRLGGESVSIIYRRTRKEMPAISEEIDQAIEEGIQLCQLTSPLEYVIEDNRLKGLKIIENRPGKPDSSGRARPVPICGTERVVPCDMIISALGQKVQAAVIEGSGLAPGEKGTIKVNKNTCMTDIPGVFAGGDAVSGAATVIEAIGAGKKAALAIDCFIRGIPLPRLPQLSEIGEERKKELAGRARNISRAHPAITPVKERVSSFVEIEGRLGEDEAKREAERCLNCGDCSNCMECERVCNEAKAIRHDDAPRRFTIQASWLLTDETHRNEISVSREDKREEEGRSAVKRPGERILVCLKEKVSRESFDSLQNALSSFDLPIQWEKKSLEEMSGAYIRLAACGISREEGVRSVSRESSGKRERDQIAGRETERKGVFLCCCGEDPDKDLPRFAITLPGVRTASLHKNLCSDYSLGVIREKIQKERLSHVAIGGCACCTLDRICEGCSFSRVRAKRRILESVPLPASQIELFNIRELGGWVETGDGKRIKSLISMALERLSACSPFHHLEISRDPGVLILDGGREALKLAGLLQSSGFKPVVWYSRKSPRESTGVTIADGTLKSLAWEQGNFLAAFSSPHREYTIRAGACVTYGDFPGLTPYLKHALEVNSGRFPGLFPSEDISVLPESLQALHPYLMSAAIGSFLSRRFDLLTPAKLSLNESLCRECRKCIDICPYGFLSMQEGGQGPGFHPELCQSCGLCVMTCNTQALHMIPAQMKHYEALLDCILKSRH